MDDVRHAAEERAARPKKAPVGSSFESERQREKNALVRQLDAQDGRNVHKISAAPEIPEGERVLRVAAYCRVSTDDIDLLYQQAGGCDVYSVPDQSRRTQARDKTLRGGSP